MSKPNRKSFPELTEKQQIASIAGSESGQKRKREVYRKMKQQRRQGNAG